MAVLPIDPVRPEWSAANQFGPSGRMVDHTTNPSKRTPPPTTPNTPSRSFALQMNIYTEKTNPINVALRELGSLTCVVVWRLFIAARRSVGAPIADRPGQSWSEFARPQEREKRVHIDGIHLGVTAAASPISRAAIQWPAGDRRTAWQEKELTE
ncbi:hypothetical protein TNCV_3058031 [Trichonephila clavipes]|nr:hypothetical protein TNCV_3058031 [Trichonephila clavipes]